MYGKSMPARWRTSQLTTNDSWKIFQFRRDQLLLSAGLRHARLAGWLLVASGIITLSQCRRRPKLSQSPLALLYISAVGFRCGGLDVFLRRVVAARNWCPSNSSVDRLIDVDETEIVRGCWASSATDDPKISFLVCVGLHLRAFGFSIVDSVSSVSFRLFRVFVQFSVSSVRQDFSCFWVQANLASCTRLWQP